MDLLMQNITLNYGKKEVLSNINSNLECGIYGLLGENGAGKTSLLKILCGLTSPTRGRILYNNSEIEKMGIQYRVNIGYLPQVTPYYPDFSVMDYLLYFATIKGVSNGKEHVGDLLHEAGLDSVQNYKMKNLSEGMKRKAAILQSLLGEPPILIFDEPTAGLDPNERNKFKRMINRYCDNHIIIIATHLVSDLEQLADRIIVLSKGKVIKQGEKTSLLTELHGKVWESKLPIEMIHNINPKDKIIYKDKDYFTVKTIINEKPYDNSEQAVPDLEDLYSYYF